MRVVLCLVNFLSSLTFITKKLRNRLFISPSSYFSVSSDPKRFHYFSFFTSLLAIMAFSPASSGLYISDNKQMVACQKSRLQPDTAAIQSQPCCCPTLRLICNAPIHLNSKVSRHGFHCERTETCLCSFTTWQHMVSSVTPSVSLCLLCSKCARVRAEAEVQFQCRLFGCQLVTHKLPRRIS